MVFIISCTKELYQETIIFLIVLASLSGSNKVLLIRQFKSDSVKDSLKTRVS